MHKYDLTAATAQSYHAHTGHLCRSAMLFLTFYFWSRRHLLRRDYEAKCSGSPSKTSGGSSFNPGVGGVSWACCWCFLLDGATEGKVVVLGKGNYLGASRSGDPSGHKLGLNLFLWSGQDHGGGNPSNKSIAVSPWL
ncbi:hypothetical protein ISCGN_002137 [Ixodes scapularis]